jgi:uncharacterized tellurite resistance protein B-like protein
MMGRHPEQSGCHDRFALYSVPQQAMIDLIKKIFASNEGAGSSTAQTDTARNVRVAACALLLAMAESDDEFSDVEYEHIIEVIGNEYGLADDNAEQLLEMSREKLKGSIDLWQFTNLINQNYPKEEKIRIVELIWRIVYADGHLNEHEQLLVRKLTKMLRVTQREMIDAKLRVLYENGEKS